MAGSSEIENSSIIQRQINQLTNSEIDPTTSVTHDYTQRDHSTQATSEFQGSGDHDLSASYKKQVHQLETEIADLEAMLDLEKKKSFGKDKDFKLWLRNKNVSRLTTAEVQEEIEKLEEELDLNQKLTGIQFEKTNWTPLQQDGSVLSRQHFIEGYCNGSPFQMTFDMEEDFSVQNHFNLTELTLYVEDDMEAVIGEQLQQLTEDREVPSFFTILVTYHKWQTERDRVMTEFVQKYPDLVQREQSENNHYLVIENKDLNRPIFVLNWSYTASPLYYIERKLSLAVKVPQKMLETDKTDTLAATPQMFSSMVDKMGVERALESLVHMVTTTGDSDT